MTKKTLVIGASENTERYSNKAIHALQKYQQPAVAIGNKPGKVLDVNIDIEKIHYENIDTVSLYVGKARQPEYYEYILSLRPNRIIFNPGTENEELVQLASQANIQCLEACTLVMLHTGQY